MPATEQRSVENLGERTSQSPRGTCVDSGDSCEDERHEVVSTALLFGIVLLGVVYLLLCPLSRTFSDSLFGTAEYGFYFRIVFASLCFDTVAELALAHVRAGC